MRTVRARWNAEDIARATQSEESTLCETPSASGHGHEPHADAWECETPTAGVIVSKCKRSEKSGASGHSYKPQVVAWEPEEPNVAIDAVEYMKERQRIRRVLEAWWANDDAFLGNHVKSIGEPWLLSSEHKHLWTEYVQKLANREASLTTWLTKVDASCAGEEPWAP